MDHLKGQLIGVRHLLRGFLKREQLIGAKVALVIGGSGAGKDRFAEVLIGIAHSASCVMVAVARSMVMAGRLACRDTACHRPLRFTQTSVSRKSPAASFWSAVYC